LTLTSLVGCASTREEHGSVLMEDVIVQRTTVRSTKENPRPKSSGGIVIEGDNINIGTIILNSPGAVVDNSVKQVQMQQNLNSPSNSNYKSDDSITIQENNKSFDIDRDYFSNTVKKFPQLMPSLIMHVLR
jgi:hypothetical protein